MISLSRYVYIIPFFTFLRHFSHFSPWHHLSLSSTATRLLMKMMLKLHLLVYASHSLSSSSSSHPLLKWTILFLHVEHTFSCISFFILLIPSSWLWDDLPLKKREDRNDDLNYRNDDQIWRLKAENEIFERRLDQKSHWKRHLFLPLTPLLTFFNFFFFFPSSTPEERGKVMPKNRQRKERKVHHHFRSERRRTKTNLCNDTSKGIFHRE